MQIIRSSWNEIAFLVIDFRFVFDPAPSSLINLVLNGAEPLVVKGVAMLAFNRSNPSAIIASGQASAILTKF